MQALSFSNCNLHRFFTMEAFVIFLIILISQNGVSQPQFTTVTGYVADQNDQQALEFASVLVYKLPDSIFIMGTITNGDGLYRLNEIPEGTYFLVASYVGYKPEFRQFRAGRLNDFLDLGTIYLHSSDAMLDEIVVSGRQEEIRQSMDKKIYLLEDNISMQGGTLLQAIGNLPGVGTDEDGNLLIRGSDQIMVLIDGKQTALTGHGNQQGLNSIPASSIERIEIINNPSASYDASGMAGIVNIIFKKEKEAGFNLRAGFTGGLGYFTLKQQSAPELRKPYQFTPKLNPTFAVNYRKDHFNFFSAADILWHQQVMKNEFATLNFDDGSIIDRQFTESRTQPIYNLRIGMDWEPNERHTYTLSLLGNYRAYIDLGDISFINPVQDDPFRIWQYYEEEVNQTLTANLSHTYKFQQPGHKFETSFSYAFRRKDEVFYFENRLDDFFGTDTTALIADEHIFDLEIDYTRPLRFGRFEAGSKQRSRVFPNFIAFYPGMNSILDQALAGNAEYREWMSAIYGNLIAELEEWEIEAGLRLEFVNVNYLVDPNHRIYSTDGFSYVQPFPSVRVSRSINPNSGMSLFYNRRVDRPEERNLRAFPTYADPEILHIGNPSLIPQFSQTIELGYKYSLKSGYLYSAVYYRSLKNILTQVLTSFPETQQLTAIDQNAGNGTNYGAELVYNQSVNQVFRFEINANIYQNTIAAHTIPPVFELQQEIQISDQSTTTGFGNLILFFTLPKDFQAQLSFRYQAKNIIPQGIIYPNYGLNAGLKKMVLNGKGEISLQMSDILNSMYIQKKIDGNDFTMRSTDYLETQSIRLGYNHRF